MRFSTGDLSIGSQWHFCPSSSSASFSYLVHKRHVLQVPVLVNVLSDVYCDRMDGQMAAVDMKGVGKRGAVVGGHEVMMAWTKDRGVVIVQVTQHLRV